MSRSPRSPQSQEEIMDSSSSLQLRESPTVIAEVESLQPHLPLQTLRAHLETLLDTLSNTLSKTTSFPALQTRLQTSVLSTARLLEQTRTTLSLFQSATLKNIDDVTLTLHLLSDNLVSPAQKILSKSTVTNQRLAQASNQLALSFESAASDLSDTLGEAYLTERTQRAKIEQLHRSTESSYAYISRVRLEHAEADAKFSEASSLYDSAQRREAVAQRRGNILHAAHVSAVVASVVTTRSTALTVSVTGVAALAAASDQQAARAREERAVHLRQKNDARDERSSAGGKLAEVSEKLRSMRREAVVADSVLEGLEKSIQVLREMAGVMVIVEGFWKKVGARVDGGIVEMVSAGAELPKDERHAFWECESFRGRVDQTVEFWTAVVLICQRGLDGVDGLAICDGSAKEGTPSSQPKRLGNVTQTIENSR